MILNPHLIKQHPMQYKIQIFLFVVLMMAYSGSMAQNPTPALPQSKSILLLNGTAHIGNGTVLENAAIGFKDGKITLVADARLIRLASGAFDTTINCSGKHIYPGFIALNTELGLREIEMVRATNDQNETGKYNPSARSISSYNTDSKVIPTVRNNGVLLAEIAPGGGIITGTSSVVELDAWNWEDAAYKTDVGIHLNFPSMRIFSSGDAGKDAEQAERLQKNISDLKTFFSEAKAYCISAPIEKNLHFQSMCGLFSGTQKLFVHCNDAREILAAVNLCKEFNITMVLVGGADAHHLTQLLKENKIPVVITRTQALPHRQDDDINLPYKLPSILQKAGVEFAITDGGYWQMRNLAFQAGNTVAFGLTPEQALTSITLSPARILGISQTAGSIEQQKDATLFISSGDVLDMRGNNIEWAFIRGKQIDLDDIQKQLYRKYVSKFRLKE